MIRSILGPIAFGLMLALLTPTLAFGVNLAKAGPFPLLTMDQVAKLEYRQRVRYIKEFRKALVSADQLFQKFQKQMPEYAGLAPTENNKHWAIVFGNYAFAETEHYRGQAITDQCIYTFNLIDWTRNNDNGRTKYVQNYGCAMPPNCKTRDNGPGHACGFLGSGLSGPDACIPIAQRLTSTEECFKKVNEKIRRDGTPALDLVREYKAYVGSTSNANVILNDQKWTEKLIDYSWHPEVFALLIERAEFFRKHQREFLDTAALTKKINITGYKDFSDAFNTLSKGLNSIFQNFDEHCQKPLNKKVQDGIDNQNHNWWPEREKERKRLQATERKAGRTPTVGTVLQPWECREKDKRKEAIRDAMTRVNTTYPCVNGEANCPVDARPSPPVPPPIPKSDFTIKELRALGCIEESPDKNHQYQSGFRCVTCQAERDVINTKNQDYIYSPRWTSLLEVMAVACNDDTGKDSFVSVPPEVAQNYIETFGHCHRDVYSWEESPPSPELKAEIKKWARGIPSSKGPKKVDYSKLGDKFQEAYGITFKEAQEMFDCDATGATNSWFGGGSSSSLSILDDPEGGNSNSQTSSHPKSKCSSRSDYACRKDVRRQSFLKKSEGIIKTSLSKKYPAQGLKHAIGLCLTQAKEIAEELYPKDCHTTFEKTNTGNRNALRKLFGTYENPGRGQLSTGAYVNSGGSCAVAKQMERFQYKSDSNQPAQSTRVVMAMAGHFVNEPSANGGLNPNEVPDGTRDFTYDVERNMFIGSRGGPDDKKRPLSIPVRSGKTCPETTADTTDLNPWRRIFTIPNNALEGAK